MYDVAVGAPLPDGPVVRPKRRVGLRETRELNVKLKADAAKEPGAT